MFSIGQRVVLTQNFDGIRKGTIGIVIDRHIHKKHWFFEADGISGRWIETQFLKPLSLTDQKVNFLGQEGTIIYVDPNDDARHRIRVKFNNGENIWFTYEGKLDNVFNEGFEYVQT